MLEETFGGEPAGNAGLRAVRLALVALAAALGGSACGTAFLLLPQRLFAGSSDDASAAGIIFLFSLPFTLVGAVALAGLSLLWRDSLGERLADYGGLILVACLLGALMPLPIFGAGGMIVGSLFAALTSGLWALLYRAFALPPDLRSHDHG
jgi:hypothetical protein